MFTIRPIQMLTKSVVNIRMNPARHRISGAAASNAVRSPRYGQWATDTVAIPLTSPAAIGSFDRTRQGRAG